MAEKENIKLGDVVAKHFKNYFAKHDADLMPSNLYKQVIEDVEITLINETLQATRGNQIKAAEILGINRNTLRKKILQHKPVKAKSKKH